MAEGVRKKGKKNRKHGRKKRKPTQKRRIERELRRIGNAPMTNKERIFVARHRSGMKF